MLSFECPRCQSSVEDHYYGPCATCRADLRSTQAGEAKDIVAEEYIPKMNVTPNAVASKD